jgi:DNA invertase Pin-like site-specific DNA recombinase
MSSTLQERSIGQQRGWAQPTAQAEGVEIVQEFEDAALSGTEATRRNAFQEMLRFCQDQARQKHPIDALVMWKTDRFSRADSIETAWYVQEFRNAGVERILTSTRWFDFSRREDRVIFGIEQDCTNNQYSADLAQKSVRGRIDNAREGRWNGGPTPFGYVIQYEWVQVRGRRKQRPLCLAPDPEKADTLRWIFTEYASGRPSLWELAQQLDGRGVAPPGRSRYWNPTTISVILRNEVYLGDAVWNRRRSGKFFGTLDNLPVARSGRRSGEEKVPARHHVRKPQAHEPLVDRDTWEAAQRQLEQRRKRTARRLARDFRLSGLLICGHCGGRMLAAHKPLRGRATKGCHERVYICGNYSRHGLRACHRNGIAEGALFGAIAGKLKAELLNPETVERLREIVRKLVDRPATPAVVERERMGRRLAELETLISAAARKLIAEDVPAILTACRAEIVRLTEEKEQLEEAIALADRRPARGDDPQAIVDRVEALRIRFDASLARRDPAEARAVLGELVDRVELFFSHAPAGGRGTMCAFAKGLVYLRGDDLPVSLLSTENRRCG